MRHSEILRARFEHLDLERHRLFVPDAKAGMREQPITPQLADILRKEREMALVDLSHHVAAHMHRLSQRHEQAVP